MSGLYGAYPVYQGYSAAQQAQLYAKPNVQYGMPQYAYGGAWQAPSMPPQPTSWQYQQVPAVPPTSVAAAGVPLPPHPQYWPGSGQAYPMPTYQGSSYQSPQMSPANQPLLSPANQPLLSPSPNSSESNQGEDEASSGDTSVSPVVEASPPNEADTSVLSPKKPPHPLPHPSLLQGAPVHLGPIVYQRVSHAFMPPPFLMSPVLVRPPLLPAPPGQHLPPPNLNKPPPLIPPTPLAKPQIPASVRSQAPPLNLQYPSPSAQPHGQSVVRPPESQSPSLSHHQPPPSLNPQVMPSSSTSSVLPLMEPSIEPVQDREDTASPKTTSSTLKKVKHSSVQKGIDTSPTCDWARHRLALSHRVKRDQVKAVTNHKGVMSSHGAAATDGETPVKIDKNSPEGQIYSKFIEVLRECGPIEAIDERVLTLFIRLDKSDRKLVMAQGSIKAFLIRHPLIELSDNKLFIKEMPELDQEEPEPTPTSTPPPPSSSANRRVMNDGSAGPDVRGGTAGIFGPYRRQFESESDDDYPEALDSTADDDLFAQKASECGIQVAKPGQKAKLSRSQSKESTDTDSRPEEYTQVDEGGCYNQTWSRGDVESDTFDVAEISAHSAMSVLETSAVSSITSNSCVNSKSDCDKNCNHSLCIEIRKLVSCRSDPDNDDPIEKVAAGLLADVFQQVRTDLQNELLKNADMLDSRKENGDCETNEVVNSETIDGGNVVSGLNVNSMEFKPRARKLSTGLNVNSREFIPRQSSSPSACGLPSPSPSSASSEISFDPNTSKEFVPRKSSISNGASSETTSRVLASDALNTESVCAQLALDNGSGDKACLLGTPSVPSVGRKPGRVPAVNLSRFITLSKAKLHRNTQTDSPSVKDAVVGTRSLKTREVAVITGSCNVREVAINTVETLETLSEDYQPVFPDTCDVQTSTDKLRTHNKKLQVGPARGHLRVAEKDCQTEALLEALLPSGVGAEHAAPCVVEKDCQTEEVSLASQPTPSSDQECQTEPESRPSTPEPIAPIIVDHERYEAVQHRALMAEEKVLQLHIHICISQLVHALGDVEARYKADSQLFCLGQREKEQLQAQYSKMKQYIKTEMGRLEVLYDSNLSLLRDGMCLDDLPEIKATIPQMSYKVVPAQIAPDLSGIAETISPSKAPQQTSPRTIQQDKLLPHDALMTASRPSTGQNCAYTAHWKSREPNNNTPSMFTRTSPVCSPSASSVPKLSPSLTMEPNVFISYASNDTAANSCAPPPQVNETVYTKPVVADSLTYSPHDNASSCDNSSEQYSSLDIRYDDDPEPSSLEISATDVGTDGSSLCPAAHVKTDHVDQAVPAENVRDSEDVDDSHNTDNNSLSGEAPTVPVTVVQEAEPGPDAAASEMMEERGGDAICAQDEVAIQPALPNKESIQSCEEVAENVEEHLDVDVGSVETGDVSTVTSCEEKLPTSDAIADVKDDVAASGAAHAGHPASIIPDDAGDTDMASEVVNTHTSEMENPELQPSLHTAESELPSETADLESQTPVQTADVNDLTAATAETNSRSVVADVTCSEPVQDNVSAEHLDSTAPENCALPDETEDEVKEVVADSTSTNNELMAPEESFDATEEDGDEMAEDTCAALTGADSDYTGITMEDLKNEAKSRRSRNVSICSQESTHSSLSQSSSRKKRAKEKERKDKKKKAKAVKTSLKLSESYDTTPEVCSTDSPREASPSHSSDTVFTPRDSEMKAEEEMESASSCNTPELSFGGSHENSPAVEDVPVSSEEQPLSPASVAEVAKADPAITMVTTDPAVAMASADPAIAVAQPDVPQLDAQALLQQVMVMLIQMDQSLAMNPQMLQMLALQHLQNMQMMGLVKLTAQETESLRLMQIASQMQGQMMGPAGLPDQMQGQMMGPAALPDQLQPVPAQNPPFPAQTGAVPAQNAAVTSHNQAMPAQHEALSTSNETVSAQNEPLPSHNQVHILPQHTPTGQAQINSLDGYGHNSSNSSQSVPTSTHKHGPAAIPNGLPDRRMHTEYDPAMHGVSAQSSQNLSQKHSHSDMNGHEEHEYNQEEEPQESQQEMLDRIAAEKAVARLAKQNAGEKYVHPNRVPTPKKVVDQASQKNAWSAVPSVKIQPAAQPASVRMAPVFNARVGGDEWEDDVAEYPTAFCWQEPDPSIRTLPPGDPNYPPLSGSKPASAPRANPTPIHSNSQLDDFTALPTSAQSYIPPPTKPAAGLSGWSNIAKTAKPPPPDTKKISGLKGIASTIAAATAPKSEIKEEPNKKLTSLGKTTGQNRSGSSEISGIDDFPPLSAATKTNEEEDDDWHEVTKGARAKKKMAVATNYDKVVNKLQDSYLKMTKPELIDILNDVRQQLGGLKGVKLQEIMNRVEQVIAQRTLKKRKLSTEIETAKASNLYKTAVCEYWKAGSCQRGQDCLYAHGKQEVIQHPKTILCHAFVNKKMCQYGKSCIFAHGVHELSNYNPNVKPQVSKPHEKQVQLPAQPAPGAIKPLMSVQVKGSGSLSTPNLPVLPSRHSVQLRPGGAMMRPVALAAKQTYHNIKESADLTDDARSDECIICYDSLNRNELSRLDCGHLFHANCIKRWLMGEDSTCPVCRRYVLLQDEFPPLG